MKFLRICAVLLALLAVSPFLAVEYLYYSSIRQLNLTFVNSQNTYPSFAQDMLWRVSGETGEIALEKSSAAEYLLNMLGLAVVKNGNAAGGFGAGERVIHSVAKQLVQNKTDGTIDYHVKSAAVGIWLSRQVNASDLLDYALDNLYFGFNTVGIQSAAQLYFAKKPAELARNEWLTLILLTKGASYYNPYCHPERFKERYDAMIAKYGSQWQLESEVPPSPKNVPRANCQ